MASLKIKDNLFMVFHLYYLKRIPMLKKVYGRDLLSQKNNYNHNIKGTKNRQNFSFKLSTRTLILLIPFIYLLSECSEVNVTMIKFIFMKGITETDGVVYGCRLGVIMNEFK